MISEPLPAPANLPNGLRIYAIGDVHGCAERLSDLHRLIAEDHAARPVARAVLLHLGDYVDRGADSAGVLALLRRRLPGLEPVHLLGNHDRMMLDALDPMAPEEAVDHWLANGGRTTLASYGASAADARSWQAVPAEHLEMLRACRPSFAAGGYLFAHAGIRPGIPLATQRLEDLLWIREPFLSWRERLPAVVVHGHTPAPTPQILAHRIGLDTGAVYGGALTCGVLEADGIRFLMA